MHNNADPKEVPVGHPEVPDLV